MRTGDETKANKWLVSAHPDGEVLTVEASSGGLRIVAFESVGDATRREIEIRLERLVEQAIRGAAQDRGPRQLPGSLHHGVVQMLEWAAAEGVEHPGGLIGAALFHQADNRIAFASIAGRTTVRVDDKPFDPPWSPVTHSGTRPAQAFSLFAGRALDLKLEWSSDRFAGRVSTIAAEWRNTSKVQAAIEAHRHTTVAASAKAGASATVAASPPPAPVPASSSAPSPVSSPAPAPERPATKASAPRAYRLADQPRPVRKPSDGSGRRVATSTPTPSPQRQALKPAWPAAEMSPNVWRRVAPWAIGVLALLAMGWGVRTLRQSPVTTHAKDARGNGVFAAVGFGGPRYRLVVTSDPSNATIAVDGKSVGKRTPATINLPAGRHDVALALGDRGHGTFAVTGEEGGTTRLDAGLWGSVVVHAPDARTQVSVDGAARGAAPLTIDRLVPGRHRIRFSGPEGAWERSVDVRAGEASDVVARMVRSPGAGWMEIRASRSGARGRSEVKGASVTIDGRAAGTTPLLVELPNGPHSIRVSDGTSRSPVQVLELAAGGQQFTEFQLTAGADAPRLEFVGTAGTFRRDRPTTLSAALAGLTPAEVREMSLNVRSPEGPWRRYPMRLVEAANAVVGVTVFPSALIDERGQATYYASAVTSGGISYFTDLQSPAAIATREEPLAERVIPARSIARSVPPGDAGEVAKTPHLAVTEDPAKPAAPAAGSGTVSGGGDSQPAATP